MWTQHCQRHFYFIAAISAIIGPSNAETVDELPWTVEDSVAVKYVVTNPSSPAPWQLEKDGSQSIVEAPDGAHFFFMSFYGDLESDLMVYELTVYSTDHLKVELARSSPNPRPSQQVSFASSHGGEMRAGIQQPRWENGQSILFLGTSGDSVRRLYRLDVLAGTVVALTGEEADVPISLTASGDPNQWNVVAKGAVVANDSVAFVSSEYAHWDPLGKYPTVAVRNDEIRALADARRWVGVIYGSYRGSQTRPIAKSKSSVFGPWMSPNGRWAVVAYAPKHATIPKTWLEYEYKPKDGIWFELIDLERGITRPMVDAPVGTVTGSGRGRRMPFYALWSNDSEHVILVNTALPISHSAPERKTSSYVVAYSISTHRWSIVAEMEDKNGARIEDVNWSTDGSNLIATRDARDASSGFAELYLREKNSWTGPKKTSAIDVFRSGREPALSDGISVKLREGINEPPVVIASNGSSEIALTPPDPALQHVRRVPAEIVEWRDPNGSIARGLLYWPAADPETEQLRLVIQAADAINHWEAFRPDGVSILSGFAAQSLAAQGFAVLQMESAFNSPGVFLSAKEGPAQVERIDAAIDYVLRRKRINTDCVGLVGFSRSGYLAYYAITHPGKYNLGAAVVFDSITASYGSYVDMAGLGDMGGTIFERQYGEGTFWENKSAWLDAPGFNIDKVVTPVLFSTTGKSTNILALETIGAFRIAKKPFEYINYPKGAHVLQKPRERFAAMQTTVDWMNFWLKGLERGESIDSENRISYWRKLRSDWARNSGQNDSCGTG